MRARLYGCSWKHWRAAEHPIPVVLALFWEIRLLRTVILRAGQVVDSVPHPPSGVPMVIWQAFVLEIKAEPCMSDPPTPWQQRHLARAGHAAIGHSAK